MFQCCAKRFVPAVGLDQVMDEIDLNRTVSNPQHVRLSLWCNGTYGFCPYAMSPQRFAVRNPRYVSYTSRMLRITKSPRHSCVISCQRNQRPEGEKRVAKDQPPPYSGSVSVSIGYTRGASANWY